MLQKPVVEDPPTIVDDQPDTLSELMEDDEETIAAAPDASAFAPRATSHKPGHSPIYAKLFFRRTIIPIMLTCGVMLPAIGLWSMFDQNAPFAHAGSGFDVLLIVVGALLLGLGFINALQVKQILAKA